MAEPLTSPPSGEPLTYKPLSGLALAAFLCSALFTLMVFFSTVAGLIQGVPFFFPLWTLLLAGAGVTLALLAQGQIRNSEGTRAGMGLARISLWLGLFAGLGYFAYYTVTGLALTSQADTFLMDADDNDGGFFPLLQKAASDSVRLNRAYLLTLPANQRGSARPEDAQAMRQLHDQPSRDGTPGKLTAFKKNPIVRAFLAAPVGSVTVEPLGVQGWVYESHSYKVTRLYRISSPEMVLEAAVPVQSSEGEQAGQARRWFVALPHAQKNLFKYTELGDRINELRAQAIRKMNDGEALMNDFARYDRTDWDALRAGVLSGQAVRARFTDGMTGSHREQMRFNVVPPDGLGGWERTATGHLVYTQQFTVGVPPPGPNTVGLQLEGNVRLKSRRPADPARPDDDPGGWDVLDIRFIDVRAMDPRQMPPPQGR